MKKVLLVLFALLSANCLAGGADWPDPPVHSLGGNGDWPDPPAKVA